MFRRVILQIHFPKLEFEKVACQLANIISVQYRVKNSFFYLGNIQDAYQQSSKKIIVAIEIRKDETPAWYAKSIIMAAKEKEIFVMGDSEIISKGGRISNVKGFEEFSDNDFIEPLEVWIMAKMHSSRTN